MKIAIFTNSKPRHLSFIRQVAEHVGEVIAVVESSTTQMGIVSQGYGVSDQLARYFRNVKEAETKIFGERAALPHGIRVLPMRMGDLSFASRTELKEVLDADHFVVFGSSWIRGWLINELIIRRAINIHLGIAPFYRGSACNFWALWDGRSDLVGATLHYLSADLDAGEIIKHVVPKPALNNPYEFTMQAVRAAQDGYMEHIVEGNYENPSVKQDRNLEIRYTRSKDFSSEIAEEFMNRKWDPALVLQDCLRRKESDFVSLKIL